MEKKEYFQKIAFTVHENKEISEYSKDEKIIYDRGRCDALRDVMVSNGRRWTATQLLSEMSALSKLLQGNMDSLATNEADVEVWEKPYAFSYDSLLGFVSLMITDYRVRLKKSRETYLVQQRLIDDLRCFQIE